jgi:hypothetical protein
VWNGLKNYTQFLASTFRSLRQDLSLFQAHVITCFAEWKQIVKGHTKWSGGPPVVQPWAEILLRSLCECNKRIGMKVRVLNKLVSVRWYFLLSICTGRLLNVCVFMSIYCLFVCFSFVFLLVYVKCACICIFVRGCLCFYARVLLRTSFPFRLIQIILYLVFVHLT